jgi:dTDP-4-amino-4,6-dideoxygalactose transaminase
LYGGLGESARHAGPRAQIAGAAGRPDAKREAAYDHAMKHDSANVLGLSDAAGANRRTAAALLRHYDGCLASHGDTAEGAGWPNERDRTTRFDAMLDVVAGLCGDRDTVVCDLGCGTGALLARIRERGMRNVAYVGADASGAALQRAREKFEGVPFYEVDAVSAPDAKLEPLRCDVLVANGLFTVKREITHADMWRFMTDTIRRVWPLVRRGIVFNVMSAAVDWERHDLFHVSYDELARFLHGIAGRSIGFRADYGLYEYTAYASKGAPARQPEPLRAEAPDEPRAGGRVPVYRAQLPASHRVERYLSSLDRTRWYSNHGELVRRFEARLAALLRVAPEHVVTASSGTAALAGAILGTAGRAEPLRPYCFAPAYTFVGTASAIEQCGYRLHLADVGDDWSLDPDELANHPALARTGLVVVVAPYGRLPSQPRWEEFQRRTGIPVVIDAAAGFEALTADTRPPFSTIPIALSFQASKTFSTGEGGAVIAMDAARADATLRALNFGFRGERVSRGPSINGKMSEYHAAVGLAELDGWDDKRAAFARVAAAYANEAESDGLAEHRIITAPTVASCYALLLATSAAESGAVRAALHAADVEHRLWYGGGLHREPAFAGVERDALERTDALGPRLIGLPMAPDLATSSVRRIVGTIARAVRG